jgi:hypothetical protein
MNCECSDIKPTSLIVIDSNRVNITVAHIVLEWSPNRFRLERMLLPLSASSSSTRCDRQKTTLNMDHRVSPQVSIILLYNNIVELLFLGTVYSLSVYFKGNLEVNIYKVQPSYFSRSTSSSVIREKKTCIPSGAASPV